MLRPYLAFLWAAWSLIPGIRAASTDGFHTFQDTAPEFVRVEISDVQVAETQGIFGANRTRVSATGRVVEVFRSASGLAPGSQIEIRYNHQAQAGASAETPPILEPGRVVPAFLARKGNAYVPAARHLSFQEPTEAQMKRYDAARIQSQESLLVETERRVRESLDNATQPAAQPAPPVADLREDEVVPAPESAPTPAAPPIPSIEELPLPTETPANEESSPAPAPRAEAVVETNPQEPSAIRPEIVPPAAELAPEPSASVPIPLTQETVPEVRAADEPITPVPMDSAPQPVFPSPAPSAPAPAPVLSPAPVRRAEPAAVEGYSAIFSLIKQGEAAQLEGKRDAAKEAYTLAREKLLKLKAEQPDFQPFMVEYRLKDLKRRLDDIEAAEKSEKKTP
jgi:hypothetical protein